MSKHNTHKMFCDDCDKMVDAVWSEEKGMFVCPICGSENVYDFEDDDDEIDEDGDFLRRQEAYAAYQYAGCTEGFWEDLNAGYI